MHKEAKLGNDGDGFKKHKRPVGLNDRFADL